MGVFRLSCTYPAVSVMLSCPQTVSKTVFLQAICSNQGPNAMHALRMPLKAPCTPKCSQLPRPCRSYVGEAAV